MIFIPKFTKGHNAEKCRWSWYFISAHQLILLFNIRTKFHEMSKRVSELFSGHDFNTKNYKGHNSVKCNWSYSTYSLPIV